MGNSSEWQGRQEFGRLLVAGLGMLARRARPGYTAPSTAVATETIPEGSSSMGDDRTRVVYSTGDGAKARCPRCGQAPCRCPRPTSLPPQQQAPRIQREKKGRGGKTVTVITGLQLTPDDLAALAKTLKALCGAGGTVKEGTIEIQGDHREKIAAELRRLGYKAKLAGG